MRFKTWFETLQPNPMRPGQNNSDRDGKVQDLWKRAFDALGVGGFDPADAAHESLSKLSFGNSASDPDNKGSVKGKKAALKRLANSQIFDQLKNLGDPDLAKSVQAAEEWLGNDSAESEHGARPSPTVGDLMKMLFGDNYFNSYIGKDYPKDDAKAQVQPQPPKDMNDPSGNTSMGQDTPQPPGPPQDGQMNQPQALGNMQPPAPNAPMPPKPAGAELGLF